MDPIRSLKRKPESTYNVPAQTGIDGMVSACVSELMNAGTSLHKLHLKITSTGSYAAHKALNELYDAMPGHADDIAESFQGASEKLLVYKEIAPKELNSVQEAIEYLRDLTEMVTALQAKMPYSEIINELDNVKSTIDSGKYKLLFLK
jgi:DNA-binding ferritin-like protein